MQRLVVAVIADPQLGGHEQIAAVDAAMGDALSDLGFVPVSSGGVDQAIAVLTAATVSSGPL